MLEDVKQALRISTTITAFDSEVIDLIAAARNDLRLSGVLAEKVENDSDSLIKRAVTLYCKAFFGYDNADADRQLASYNSMKAHLTLSAEYTEVPV
ncbi:head-tail connector protein [Paenibacillus harenae]|uniref:head-tail connector protein n=1 Tax=Paenibacillus harenae TaxID=306543 RepID=UPI00048C1F3E|nr:head-tail connector protein [Paenibacillus harenae]